MFASARADMDDNQIIKLFESRPISNLFIVSDLTTIKINLPIKAFQKDIEDLQEFVQQISIPSSRYQPKFNHEFDLTKESLSIQGARRVAAKAQKAILKKKSLFDEALQPMKNHLKNLNSKAKMLMKTANHVVNDLDTILATKYNDKKSELCETIAEEYPRIIINTNKNLTKFEKFNKLFFKLTNNDIDSHLRSIGQTLRIQCQIVKKDQLQKLLQIIRTFNTNIFKKIKEVNPKINSRPFQTLFSSETTPYSFQLYLQSMDIESDESKISKIFEDFQAEKRKLSNKLQQIKLLRRKRRNILSSALSYLTGLASNEELREISNTVNQLKPTLMSAAENEKILQRNMDKISKDETNIRQQILNVSTKANAIAHELVKMHKDEENSEERNYLSMLTNVYSQNILIQMFKIQREIHDIEIFLDNFQDMIYAAEQKLLLPETRSQLESFLQIQLLPVSHVDISTTENGFEATIIVPKKFEDFKVFSLNTIPFVKNRTTLIYNIDKVIAINNLHIALTEEQISTHCQHIQQLWICSADIVRTKQNCEINIVTALAGGEPFQPNLCRNKLQLHAEIEQRALLRNNEVTIYSNDEDKAVIRCLDKRTETVKINRGINIITADKNCAIESSQLILNIPAESQAHSKFENTEMQQIMSSLEQEIKQLKHHELLGQIDWNPSNYSQFEFNLQTKQTQQEILEQINNIQPQSLFSPLTPHHTYYGYAIGASVILVTIIGLLLYCICCKPCVNNETYVRVQRHQPFRRLRNSARHCLRNCTSDSNRNSESELETMDRFVNQGANTGRHVILRQPANQINNIESQRIVEQEIESSVHNVQPAFIKENMQQQPSPTAPEVSPIKMDRMYPTLSTVSDTSSTTQDGLYRTAWQKHGVQLCMPILKPDETYHLCRQHLNKMFNGESTYAGYINPVVILSHHIQYGDDLTKWPGQILEDWLEFEQKVGVGRFQRPDLIDKLTQAVVYNRANNITSGPTQQKPEDPCPIFQNDNLDPIVRQNLQTIFNKIDTSSPTYEGNYIDETFKGTKQIYESMNNINVKNFVIYEGVKNVPEHLAGTPIVSRPQSRNSRKSSTFSNSTGCYSK